MRFILALICLIALNLYASDEDVFTWYITNWPPAFILDGPNKGKGFADELVDILEKEMPHYRHDRVILPYARILKYIKAGNQGCYPTNIYDKKQDFGIVSAPTMLVAGHNVYIHKTNKSKFPGEGRASLTTLLENQNIKLGIRADLEFGSTLSPILKAHSNNKNFVLRSGPDLIDGLVKMLQQGRIDYLIEYNFVMKFVTAKLGFQMTDFIEIAIKENRDEFIRGAVECPDSKWGREVIVEINKVLQRVRTTPDFIALNKKWFVSESANNVFWNKYMELILSVPQ